MCPLFHYTGLFGVNAPIVCGDVGGGGADARIHVSNLLQMTIYELKFRSVEGLSTLDEQE